MKKQTLAFFLCTLITTSICGIAYAQWNDVITMSTKMTFGNMKLAFVDPVTCGEYHEDPSTGQIMPGEYKGKDVGRFQCDYDQPIQDGEGYTVLVANLFNAYPGYAVQCNFTLKNTGSLPLHINDTQIYDPTLTLEWEQGQGALIDPDTGEPIIKIDFEPELVCNILEPAASAKFVMTIRIFEGAEECNTYNFEVDISYEEVK